MENKVEDGERIHGYVVSEGMTLRDWFAGQCLKSFTSEEISGPDLSIHEIANMCYEQADAMLQARAPSPSTGGK